MAGKYLCLVLGALNLLLGSANALTTGDLLRPDLVENVQLSPSGTRIAFLRRGDKSDRDFVVLKRDGGQFTPLFVTRLPGNQSFKSYQWLADDYLTMSYSRADETLDQLAIANIPKQTVTVLEPAARVVKRHWHDDQHALVSTSIGCSVSGNDGLGRCLVSVNLNSQGRNSVTPFLKLFPIGFTVLSETEIYARGSDAQRAEHAMRYDIAANTWKEIDMAELTQAVQAKRSTLNMTAANPAKRYVGIENQPPVGYISPAPQRAFTAVDPAFDTVEVALETRFSGKRATLEQVSDDLRVGLIKVESLDSPTQYALWERDQSLTLLNTFDSPLSGQSLGTTRIESQWVAESNIAITTPPAQTAVTAIVVHPTLTAPILRTTVPSSFDGQAHAFAIAGVTHIELMLGMPIKIATGAQPERWRQRTHQILQTVIDAARKAAGPNIPVCLYAEKYVAALLLTDGGFDNLTCIAALSPPLKPEMLSDRIKLSNTAYLKLANAVLEREVRGVFATANNGLLNPAERVATLPAQLFLAYDLTEPVNEVFGRNSNDFRSAAKKAGKQLSYEASTGDREDESAYKARLMAHVIDFVGHASKQVSTAATK